MHMSGNELFFKRFRKLTKKRLLALSRQSARMEQFGSHWTDFHENLYLNIFRKYA
jgi:hypothetical protein